MKKIFIIICALFVGIAYADNVITSKEYVDGQSAALQQQVPAKNTNTVLTYPAAGTDTPGEKAIYDSSAAYGEQTDALVTAGQFNNALQVALDTEFVCVSRNDQGCLLYEIRAATQKQILPSGYTQLEYLKSTGTQYILTDIPWSSVKRFRGKAQETAILGVLNKAVLGSSTSTAATSASPYRKMYGTYYHGDTGIAEWYWDTNISPLVAASFDIAKAPADYVWMGTVNNLQTSGALYSELNVVLMSSYDTNFTRRAFNGSVWYIQLFGENGNMIFNGIPARRDSDDKVGLYDIVTNTFFTNSGTGNFIAGPVVSSNLYLPSGN